MPSAFRIPVPPIPHDPRRNSRSAASDNLAVSLIVPIALLVFILAAHSSIPAAVDFPSEGATVSQPPASPPEVFSESTAVPTPRRILLALEPNPKSRAVALRVADTLGARLEPMRGSGCHAVLTLPKGTSPLAASRQAAAMPGVVAAAPDYTRRLGQRIPNDPQFSPNQWAFHNTGQTIRFRIYPEDPETVLSCVPDADVDAPEAWELSTGSRDVIVAVIDSGFPMSNADLLPALWSNPGEIAGNGLDDDGNGYIDDVNGYDFHRDSPSVDDQHGHGSFCSGLIGARGNDGVGIAGINWSVTIMPLVSFSEKGEATDAHLIEAIDYAVAHGAHIINASWGDWMYSPVVEQAIRRAGEQGVLFVAAAGNDLTNLVNKPFYPASLPLRNLVSVGATDWRDGWAEFSNYSSTLCDIAAPGHWVYSIRPTKYEYASGTSFAAPIVSGIAALLLAREPGLDLDALRRRLVTAVEDRPAMVGRVATRGRISAYRALAAPATDAIPPAPVQNLDILETATNGFRFVFTAPGDDAGAGRSLYYDVRISKIPITESNFHECPRVPYIPRPVEGGRREELLVTSLEPSTRYYLRLRAFDDAGHAVLSNEATAVTRGRTVYFTDDMENGAVKWSVSGTFELTTETARSGQWCWTDSPGGNYGKAKTGTLTLAQPLDFSDARNPWLRFYHQHYFDKSVTSVYDNGSVQVSTDGTTWRTLRQYVHVLSPFHRAAVNLSEYAGQPVVHLRFRFRSDSFNEADGWYIDDVEVYEPDALLAEPADLVVESRTQFAVTVAPEYEEVVAGGNWMDSVGKAALPQLNGWARSRYKTLAQKGSTARFTPNFPVAGRWEVYAAWGQYANAANVRYRVSHAEGTTDVLITQDARSNANQWVRLGTWRFEAGVSGAAGSVLVDDATITGAPNTAAEGRVYADAVRFVWLPPDLPTPTPSPSPTASWTPLPSSDARGWLLH